MIFPNLLIIHGQWGSSQNLENLLNLIPTGMKLFIHGYGYIYIYMVYCSPLLNVTVDIEASYTRNCLIPIFKAYQKWLCYIFKFIPNSYA